MNVNHVQEALVKIKQGKSDGNIGLTTDYLKHGFHKLCLYLSVLFLTMLSHGHASKAMRLSTIIPIPKNIKKSLNDSDNYRRIALNSVLEKVLDWVILNTCCAVCST